MTESTPGILDAQLFILNEKGKVLAHVTPECIPDSDATDFSDESLEMLKALENLYRLTQFLSSRTLKLQFVIEHIKEAEMIIAKATQNL